MVTVANGHFSTCCLELLQASDVRKINYNMMHYDPEATSIHVKVLHRNRTLFINIGIDGGHLEFYGTERRKKWKKFFFSGNVICLDKS